MSAYIIIMMSFNLQVTSPCIIAGPGWSVTLTVGESGTCFNSITIVLVWAPIIICPILLEIGMVIGYYNWMAKSGNEPSQILSNLSFFLKMAIFYHQTKNITENGIKW